MSFFLWGGRVTDEYDERYVTIKSSEGPCRLDFVGELYCGNDDDKVVNAEVGLFPFSIGILNFKVD